MPYLVSSPTRVTAAGNKPKLIEEFVGRVSNGESRLSVARMRSPGGWLEPGQTPEFDEFTLVLQGTLRLAHKSGLLDVAAGQAVVALAGEWVQYSTPSPEGAEYIALFDPETEMISFAYHVDGRKRVAQALVESEEKFRALFQASSQGVMLHDEERYLEVNPAAVRILGYRRGEELIGKHPRDSRGPGVENVMAQRDRGAFQKTKYAEGRDAATFGATL